MGLRREPFDFGIVPFPLGSSAKILHSLRQIRLLNSVFEYFIVKWISDDLFANFFETTSSSIRV